MQGNYSGVCWTARSEGTVLTKLPSLLTPIVSSGASWNRSQFGQFAERSHRTHWKLYSWFITGRGYKLTVIKERDSWSRVKERSRCGASICPSLLGAWVALPPQTMMCDSVQRFADQETSPESVVSRYFFRCCITQCLCDWPLVSRPSTANTFSLHFLWI